MVWMDKTRNHAAGRNIEIPEEGFYYSTCQPNMHVLEEGGGRLSRVVG
jgi:hypothetical protein